MAVYKDGVLRKRYFYDHTGLRIVAVDAEGRSTIYLYDLAGNLIQERAGEEIRNHIWALGKHLARVDGVIGDPASKVYWYHTDHLGTVEVISDAQGQVVRRNEYRAFGEQMGPEVEEIENAQAFTGKDWDEEVGLYYFNARWYDPELGRFISEDPVGDPNNPNLYAYARNNPLVVFDPTGMTSLADIGLTPTTTGATWEELESTEIDEPSAPASTEEEVPPSPGEAKQQAENLGQLRYLRNLGITSVPYKSTLVEEGVKGDGIGEWVKISINAHSSLTQYTTTPFFIYRIGVVPGYAKSMKTWIENNRIKKLLIIIHSPPPLAPHEHEWVVLRLNLKDEMKVQLFDIPNDKQAGNLEPMVKEIWLKIEEVYKGTKYDDTCISEFIAIGGFSS